MGYPSSGIKSSAKTTQRSGTTGPGLGTIPRYRFTVLAGSCISPGPRLSLGGHGDTLGCSAALALLPYATSQLSRGSLTAFLTVGRRPGLIKIVLGCILKKKQQHQGKQRAALREGLGEADLAAGMFSHGMLPQGGLLRKRGAVVEHDGGSALFLCLLDIRISHGSGHVACPALLAGFIPLA